MPNGSCTHYSSISPLLFSDRKPLDFFILPDLVSHCPYTPRNNEHCDTQARSSEKWFLKIAQHPEKKRTAFMGLKAGELTASCYPDATADRLRVCDDFMNYLFNLDDWLDEFDVSGTNGMRDCCIGAMRDPDGFQTDKKAGVLTKCFFKRFLKFGAGNGCRDRFIHSMDLFFKAVAKQSRDRANGVIPDLDSYIEVRRDTSGCKPCFQLIEFAGGFDLPDEVVQTHEIQEMEEATNDLVTWSNDIFSYSVEQARHDTHNMICVFMREGNTLQEAVDIVGRKCEESIQRFERNRQLVPKWGPKIDRMVELYIDGLQNWIVGSLHWSFQTERYFFKTGGEVKKTRFVQLLPKRNVVPGSHN